MTPLGTGVDGAVCVPRAVHAPPAASGISHAAIHQRRAAGVARWCRGCLTGDRSRLVVIHVRNGLSLDRRFDAHRRSEPVASTWNRGDVDRLCRIIAERATQDRDAVRQAVVGYKRANNQLDQLLFFHDAVVVLEQHRQRVECLGRDRDDVHASRKRPVGDVQPEGTERIDFAWLRHCGFPTAYGSRGGGIIDQNFHHDSTPFQGSVRTSTCRRT